MSLLDLHTDALKGAAPLYVPPAPVDKPFFSWGMLTAPTRAVTSAAAEVIASGVEFAYAPVKRTRLDSPDGAMSNDVADSIRAAGRSYATNPETAGYADELLYGFLRPAAKLIAGGMALGPAGIALAAAEEANTQADELKQKGVTDLRTRINAGAVQGAGLALAALPVVGQTWKATAGLYAIGGPGGFMAQQAATREILQSAGYDKLGMQYDPTDRMGLAVSALLPLPFVAWGIRGQRIKAETDKALAGIKPFDMNTPPTDPVPGAVPGAAVESAPFPGVLTEVARAAGRYVPPEVLDAAMVRNLQDHITQNRIQPDDPLVSRIEDEQIARVEDALQEGVAPDVASVPVRGAVDEAATAPIREHIATVTRNLDTILEDAGVTVEQVRAVTRTEPPRAVSFDDLIAELGPATAPPVSSVADELRYLANGAGWAIEGGRMIRSGISEAGDQGMGGSVVGRTPWVPHEAWFASMRTTMGSAGLSNAKDIQAAVEKATSGQKLRPIEQRTVDYMRWEVKRMKDALTSLDDPEDKFASDALDAGFTFRDSADIEMTARAAEIDEAAVERAAIQYENDDAAFRAEMERIISAHQEATAKPATPTDAGASAGEAGPAKSPSQEGPSDHLTLTAQTFDELKARAAEQAKAREADAAEQKRLEDRARADAMTPEFTLTGSTRAADANANQGGLFDLPERDAPTTSRFARLEVENPQLIVARDSDGRAISLADEMEAVRREAKEGTLDLIGDDDLGLLDAAVQCALGE